MLPSCPGCNQRRFVNILDDAVIPEEFERLCNAPKMQSHGKQNYFPIAGVRAMHRKDDLGSGPIEVRGAIWFRLREETEDERPVLADG